MQTAKMMLAALTLAAAGASGATHVWAGDTIDDGFRLFDELRLGAYAHNLRKETTPYDKEINGTDISGEVLSSPLSKPNWGNWIYDFFLTPRLHAGVMAATNPHHTSYAFAGLTWRANIIGGLYFEPEFGMAVNNGPSHYEDNQTWLGSRFTFRESAGIGYQFTDKINLTANIEHISHAKLFNKDWNPGLTMIGARLGYKF
jgi:hypothetical protein